MLRSLHIENYILIDSLDVSFPEGLVIITGQTGAGKSILLGALSLLFGAKADASVIAEGADSCVVEAEFDIGSSGHLLIRRVIYPSGRSRSFLNDAPVQVSALQNMADRLIDIHSQHKSLLITDRKFQLSVLDAFASDRELLMECRKLWGELSALHSRIRTKREEYNRLLAEKEYSEAVLERLDSARLVPGELEALEEEHKSLSNAEQILGALSKASSLLSEEQEGPGLPVLSALREASKSLDHISSCLPAASSLASRLESSRIEIEDICEELDSVQNSIDLSPKRLEEVEDRMSELYSLMKKHNCNSIEELIEIRDRYSISVNGIEDLAEELKSLTQKENELGQRYASVCGGLTELRRNAAPGLASEIRSLLHFLELEGSDFEVSVAPCEPGLNGADSVRFLFSANGRAPEELSKVASGGEISRIMLSIKAIMARFLGMPTLIFDEIDTGVSGSVADKMGRMICSMGKDMQVFAITHLPQVAAKGSAHYLVSKSTDAQGRTSSTLSRIEGEDRVREIARLLSGSTISEAALANAEQLLNENL